MAQPEAVYAPCPKTQGRRLPGGLEAMAHTLRLN
jgi:hypothetical protein